MSDIQNHDEIISYIKGTKVALLTYLRSDLTPVTRAIGSFAPDDTDLFFSTGKETAKVSEIGKHNRVSFYIEQGDQKADTWKSVLLIGDAKPLETGSVDYATALERLGAKSPRFKERIEKGDLDSAAIYKITTSEIEYLDRSSGYAGVRKIAVIPILNQSGIFVDSSSAPHRTTGTPSSPQSSPP
jgi:pyridoxamine 5'-phosphate oxidase